MANKKGALLLRGGKSYSRLDLVGKSLSQDENNGGEDRQGGAHGPAPTDLLPLGAMLVQNTKTFPIEKD